MELEINVGKGVSEKQLKAIQKLLEPFAEGLIGKGNRNKEVEDKSMDVPLYGKLKQIILSVFRYGQWFTSLDAREVFEDFYGVSIKTATCSTYLRRMEEEGFLISRKVGKMVEYRLNENRVQDKANLQGNYIFEM